MFILMLLTNPFKPDPRVYEEAKTLVNAGYKVTIFCWDREGTYPEKEIIDGIYVKRIKKHSAYGNPISFLKGIIAFYLRALILAKNEKYDILHAHDFDTLPLGVLLKKLHNSKLVYDAHDHYSSMIKDVVPEPIPTIVRILEKILIRYTDGNIAATKDLGEAIFMPYKYEIIMNAKNLNDFHIPYDEIVNFRQKINPNNKFLIVYIGILKLWTPLPYIIEAVKRLDNVLLLIGGDGPHKAQILEMIKGYKNIKYIGWVNKNEIPIYTCASDVIILPSNPNKEYTRVAVGNKIMEALAAGKPIIAGKNTAGERIVRECNAGLICEFGDVDCLVEKIKILMENKDLRERYGKNARKCAEEKYNWDIMKERLLRFYRNL